AQRTSPPRTIPCPRTFFDDLAKRKGVGGWWVRHLLVPPPSGERDDNSRAPRYPHDPSNTAGQSVNVEDPHPSGASPRLPPRLPGGRRMDRSRIPHQRRGYGDGGPPRRAYDRQETYCPSPFLGKNSTSKKNRTLALGRFKLS